MFLHNSKSGYNRDGEQFAQGKFLILMSLDGGDHTKVKALVRHVHMGQLGNFMMGRVTIKGHKVVLSGSYGGDGLTKSVCQEVYDLGVDLPADLYDMWNKGGGWNSCGSEAPAMRAWALVAFAPTPKKVRPLYPQGKLSSIQNHVWETRLLNEMQSAIFTHIRNMTTHAELSASLVSRVYNHPVYSKLHRSSRAHLAGYMRAASDLIYQQHLQWRMWCDGKLLTREEVDQVGGWSRIDSDKSAHVWAKDPSKTYNGEVN